MTQQPPINVVDKFPELDKKLIELLTSLTPEEWNAPTVAKLWTVKDVAAHLLDTNIRTLSMLRDNYSTSLPSINSYQDLLDYLNGLNADWVKAMKRVSPEMLVLLHKITGPLYCDYYQSLDPFGKAAFAVAWAGEEESKNWMHIARDYTEKFLHQQQIRDAVNKPGLMNREYFYPFINIFMLALPHTYRDVKAANGTAVKIHITGDAGGSWLLIRSVDKWQLSNEAITKVDAEVILTADDSWKLFSKSWSPADVADKVRITGNHELGAVALTMVSVMA